MKAVVSHGVGDIRLDNVKEPSIQHDFDAIVHLTASAICGTDLHFVRGTVPGIQEGTVHTGVFDPSAILTKLETLTSAVDAYKLFDRREPGWIKVELLPAA